LYVNAQLGWLVSYSDGTPDKFVPGLANPYPGNLPANVAYAPTQECQATVTNQGTAMVYATHVDIAYYDGQGNQIVVNTVNLPVTGIGAGNTVTTGDTNVPTGAASCQVTGWDDY
jgi:hypothetical protein